MQYNLKIGVLIRNENQHISKNQILWSDTLFIDFLGMYKFKQSPAK